jgi:hypothetical protein
MESILPPNWQAYRNQDGNIVYFNEIDGKVSTENPFEVYLRMTNKESHQSYTPRMPTPQIQSFYDDQPSNESAAVENESQYKFVGAQSNENQNLRDELDAILQQSSEEKNLKETSKNVRYEYHCQWNERDLSGKVSLFGLGIRYHEATGETSIRFDGINGEWSFVSLKGPYGCLDRYDLFIGAKLEVFGRHLTISSANAAACKWNEQESQRLLKQQEQFRKKIENIGDVPCIRRKTLNSTGQIQRGVANYGKHNLRMILKDNAKLGEQLYKLGLTL